MQQAAPVDHNLAHTVLPDTLTTEELLSALTRAPAPQGVDTRTLSVGGVPIARVTTDPSHLNPITATSSEGMPALEMLAALAGHEPTGLVVVEGMRSDAGYAFVLEHGRVTGARAPGPRGDVAAWADALRERFPERLGTPATSVDDAEWVEFAADFIREHALEALEASARPGTRIALLRGDVTWIGDTIPANSAPGLQHLLLEQARRQDELPRMLGKLGDLNQLALPMYAPGPLPPGGKPTAMGPAAEWGDARPDGATSESWERSRALYPMCNGQRSIADLVEEGMFGRFRTLESMIMLAKAQSVIIVESPKSEPEPARGRVVALHGRPASSPPAPPPAPPPLSTPARPTTGYALTQRAEAESIRPRPPLPAPPPRPRIPTRTRVEPHASVVTAIPPSVRNANVGGGRTLLDALEAEIAALEEPAAAQPARTAAPGGVPAWQYVALALTGSLLFAGGVLFSNLLG